MSVHYGTTPSTIIDAMIAGLASLRAPTGHVKTIGRIESDDIEAIDRALVNGMPALLIYDDGGRVEVAATHGQRFIETVKIRLIAVAGSYQNLTARLTGTVVAPGCEELAYGGLYLALRAAAAVAGVHKVKPVNRVSAVKITPEKFICAWDIELCKQLDIYDDQPTAIITTLGLVANPTDDDQLFEVDNTTPNIDDPATKQGGVVTL